MKRFFRHILFFNFLILFFICLPSIGLAQGDPGCDPDNMRCGDPNCTFRVWCPIDKGLVILLVIGGIYGIKKVQDRNKTVPTKGTLM
jgi:hypothetical protein